MDLKTRNALVVQYMPLAHKLARRYAPYDETQRQDLFQEACIAIMAAAETFDPAFGVPFVLHAHRRIRAELGRAAPQLWSVVRRPNGTRTDNDGEVDSASYNTVPDVYDGPEDVAHRASLSRSVGRELASQLSRRDARDASIIKDRWLSDEPVTLDSIAAAFGSHRETVRQREMKLRTTLAKQLAHFEQEAA